MQLSVSSQRRIGQVREATPGTFASGGNLILRSDLTGYAQPGDRRQTHIPGGMNQANATGLLEVMSTAAYDMVPYYALMPSAFDAAFGIGAPYYSAASSTIDSVAHTTRTYRLPFGGPRRSVPTVTMFEGLVEDALRMTFGFCTELVLMSDRTGEVSGSQAFTFASRLDHTNFPGGTTATLTIAFAGTPDGGTFTLTGTNPDDGSTWITAAIPIASSAGTAAAVAAAINAATNVPAGAFSAAVSPGGPLPAVINLTTAGGPWDKQPLGTISVATNSLSGGTPPYDATIAGTAGIGAVLLPSARGMMLPGHVTHSYGAYADLDNANNLLDGSDSPVIQRSETRYPNLAVPRIFEVGGQSYTAFTDQTPWGDIRHTYTFADSNNEVFQAILADSLEAGYTNTSGICDIATPRWWQKTWTCGTTILKQRIFGNAVAPVGRGDTNGLYTRTIEIAPHQNYASGDAGGCSVEVILQSPTALIPTP
jgi:hypothetical protein